MRQLIGILLIIGALWGCKELYRYWEKVKARKEARICQGDVLLVEPEGDGRIVLVRLERPKARGPQTARLVKRKGTHPVIVGGRKVSRRS